MDPANTRDIHASLTHARARIAARGDDVLASQIALTAIPAPTGRETERAKWVARRFIELGLADVRTDEAGNVIGTRAGTNADTGVAVCAHLDTVFPEGTVTTARRNGARIFAPGIGDNGRGLAALLELARAIDGTTVRTTRPVHFVATTGEEGAGDLRGAKHYFAQTAVHAAIAIDGTGDDRIVHCAVGSRRLRVSFDGPGGHSWSDFGAPNPLHAAAVAMAQIVALRLPAEPRTTLTIARASGGLSINSIPPNAWFELDVRSTSDAPIASLDAGIRAIVAAHAPGLSATVNVIGSRPGGELPPDEPLAEIARLATGLTGRTAEFAHASTDANVPLSMGIPAITIGGGGVGGDVHTLGEWYEDRDAARGVGRALTIIVGAAL